MLGTKVSEEVTVPSNCRCLIFPILVGYTTQDVIYRWNAFRTVDIAPDMKMSQFDLISTPSGNSTDNMKSGELLQYRSRWESEFLTSPIIKYSVESECVEEDCMVGVLRMLVIRIL